jgi:alcohol dehydrogenase (cytochrome c)
MRLLLGPLPARSAEAASTPTYLPQQATAGRRVYAEHCAGCHGDRLEGREAPALTGEYFGAKWSGKTAYALFSRIKTTMPSSAPGSLSDEQYADLLAFLFENMHLFSGPRALSSDRAQLTEMTLPPASIAAIGLEPAVALPLPPAAGRNPLETMALVTESMLNNPPPEEWLTWRRTQTALGSSPLTQINKENVHRLRVAWSWSLPSGANEATPLVHDGVLFAYGYGDVVQALDAATGDLLWEYSRELPRSVAPEFKRALAIYGTNLYLAVSDGHVIALDLKTGELVWDREIGPPGVKMSAGPLIAHGKVIVGTRSLHSAADYHGGFIVALDAATGKEVWRFATIPGPTDPGGNTWNGLTREQRSGAGVWSPGSYDADLNLVFFGTGQTYDTAPLRHRLAGGAATNEALFTDTTLALDPDTGKLVWYFQHMPNDQWNLDWAFERQIVTLVVNGTRTRVLVTAGKPAIHDVLDARTGKYLFSVDAGLQNIITAIDPKSGAKTYDPLKIPGDGATPFVCPHSGGGRNWIPASLNPETRVVFVPLAETCMYMPPVPEGEAAVLTTGVRMSLSPRPSSDGLYGRLQAIDLATRKTSWIVRQRAPFTSGVLDTAGGIVFAGSLDRRFSAYDDATGKLLWDIRLNDVPNSAPISYAVEGTQYVAVVVGLGGPQSIGFAPLVPEIRNPRYRSSSIWVLKLADGR